MKNTIAQSVTESAHITAGGAIAGPGLRIKMAHKYGYKFTEEITAGKSDVVVPNSYIPSHPGLPNGLGSIKTPMAAYTASVERADENIHTLKFEDGSELINEVTYSNIRRVHE